MAEETLADELTQEEMDELDKLAYTHKRYLTPKEIAAYVLVNFGQKNLSQFVDAFKEFFMIQLFEIITLLLFFTTIFVFLILHFSSMVNFEPFSTITMEP